MCARHFRRSRWAGGCGPVGLVGKVANWLQIYETKDVKWNWKPLFGSLMNFAFYNGKKLQMQGLTICDRDLASSERELIISIFFFFFCLIFLIVVLVEPVANFNSLTYP